MTDRDLPLMELLLLERLRLPAGTRLAEMMTGEPNRRVLIAAHPKESPRAFEFTRISPTLWQHREFGL